jgi:hypothetical protein
VAEITDIDKYPEDSKQTSIEVGGGAAIPTKKDVGFLQHGGFHSLAPSLLLYI